MPLDIKIHPKINKNNRVILGLDGAAGMVALNIFMLGFVLGMVVYFISPMLGVLTTLATSAIGYLFAAKLIHNKPKRYFLDWVDSKLNPHYTQIKK